MTEALLALVAETSVRATLLAVAIGVVLAVFRIRTSSVRHTAWTALLVAMLLMPGLARVVPAVPIALPAPADWHVPAAALRRADVTASAPVATALSPTVSRSPLERGDAAATASAASPAASQSAYPVRWSAVLIGVYVAGVVFFLARLCLGLFHLWRIRLTSRPVPLPPADAPEVFESELVATPVTIGLVAPRVVLPRSWPQWPADMRAAVLAHERAHIARRDPLVALLARLNCALLWFHPLAWWLERTLATLAEHACDDEALKSVTRRRYAETLLDVAGTVRRHRGRLVWHGVGVDGDGRLGRRIDRVLEGTISQTGPRTRLAVAACCSVAIAAAIACGTQEPPAAAAPLREDPTLAADLKRQQEQAEWYRAAQRMSLDEAAALENALAQNPEDADTRRKLLTFYAWTGQNIQPWNDNVLARRRHALWLAEHHPDDKLVLNARVTRSTDPTGYARIRSVWLNNVAPPNTSAQVLGNAAWFFSDSEKPVAEQLLTRAKAQESDAARSRNWSYRLGNLYAVALVDRPPYPYNGRNDPAVAAWARGRLEKATDPDVLFSAGQFLFYQSGNRDFGRQLIERTAGMDAPAGRQARQFLTQLAPENALTPFGVPRALWPDILAKATGAERLRYLATLAELEYLSGESADWRSRQPAKPDAPGNPQREKEVARTAFAASNAYAREALQLARSLTSDPSYANAVFRANIAMGLNRFREGDREDAVGHLLAASKVPPPAEPPPEPRSMLEYRLVNYLLKQGERGSVAEYLERSASGREPATRQRMVDAAAAIRDGRMPEHYQRLLASGII